MSHLSYSLYFIFYTGQSIRNMVIKQPGSTSAGGSMDIQLRHIYKTFGNQEVIHDFSISLKSGCITTFLGPSGCGKTTLLRMIAGLEVPDSGEIYLGSRCVYSREQKIFVPSQHRGLGFVFQDFALWPHMTVFENVAFGLRASGHTHHLKEAVENALSQVHLSDYANRFPHELSGGQQQRVSFARALAYGSDCILFDEPLSALDAKLREDMRGEMRDLVSRLKTTALFVTHDQREAMEMSDYMVVLSQGRMEQYDVPEVIYSHPATPFTARFVGRSNWLDSHHLSDRKRKFYSLRGMPLLQHPGPFQPVSGAELPDSGRLAGAEMVPCRRKSHGARQKCLCLCPSKGHDFYIAIIFI